MKYIESVHTEIDITQLPVPLCILSSSHLPLAMDLNAYISIWQHVEYFLLGTGLQFVVMAKCCNIPTISCSSDRAQIHVGELHTTLSFTAQGGKPTLISIIFKWS